MVLKKSAKLCIRIAIIGVVLLVLIAGSAFTWVFSGPKSLAFLTPYVEKELNNISDRYSIKMDSSYIKWNRYSKSLGISVKQVEISDDDYDQLASIDEVMFDFSLWQFFGGSILSSDITIINPVIHLDSSLITPISLQKKPAEQTNAKRAKVFNNALNFLSKEESSRFSLKSIRIANALIHINNGESDFAWKLTEGYAHLGGHRGGKKVALEGAIDFGTTQTTFGFTVQNAHDAQLDLGVSFYNLPSYVLQDLFPWMNESLEKIHAIASGKTNFLLDEKFYVSQLDFELEDVHGTFDLRPILTKPLTISKLSTDGSLYQHFTTLTIDQGLLKLVADETINFSATVKNHAKLPTIQPDISLNAVAQNIPIKHLDFYWPTMFKKKVRQWVINNVNNGMVNEATVNINLSNAEQLASKDRYQRFIAGENVFAEPIPIKADSVDATINIAGSDLTYHPKFPTIKDISGSLHFDAHKMTAKLQKGSVGKSTISNGTAIIPNLWVKPATLEVTGDATGRTEDLLLFALPTLNNQKNNNYVKSVIQAKGESSGSLKLSLPLVKKPAYSDIEINITSDHKNVDLPNFYKGHDLINASFKFNLINNSFDTSGVANLLSKPVQFNYKQTIRADKKAHSDYTINIASSNNMLGKIGINLPFLEGPIDIDLTNKTRGELQSFKGNIDLTNSLINFERFQAIKPQNEVSTLSFNATQKQGSNTIDVANFTLKGNVINGSGSGIIDTKNSYLKSLDLNQFKYLDNIIKQAKYRQNDTSTKLNLKATKIVLKDSNFATLFKPSAGTPKRSHIKASIEHAEMKNGEQLKDVKLDMNCIKFDCEYFNFRSQIADNDVVTIIVTPNGTTQNLEINSNNAGAVIRSFNISKHIKGGTLDIEGVLETKSDNFLARGIANINNFSAVKTPVLGKVLTLASFKGFVDLLNQQGISFETFEAPFELSHDVIRIDGAKSSGASIGITSEGYIDLAKKRIDLKGAIVPAYEFNQVLGNIPVLGPILTGKKDEGLIATKYSVSGPIDNVEAKVNPLSILTPGFLRNIFE